MLHFKCELYHYGYKLYLAVGFEKMSIQLRKTVKNIHEENKNKYNSDKQIKSPPIYLINRDLTIIPRLKTH